MDGKAGKAVLGGRDREGVVERGCEDWDILLWAKDGTRSLGRGRSRGRGVGAAMAVVLLESGSAGGVSEGGCASTWAMVESGDRSVRLSSASSIPDGVQRAKGDGEVARVTLEDGGR